MFTLILSHRTSLHERRLARRHGSLTPMRFHTSCYYPHLSYNISPNPNLLTVAVPLQFPSITSLSRTSISGPLSEYNEPGEGDDSEKYILGNSDRPFDNDVESLLVESQQDREASAYVSASKLPCTPLITTDSEVSSSRLSRKPVFRQASLCLPAETEQSSSQMCQMSNQLYQNAMFRNRLNSWAGRYYGKRAGFNPYCRVHGRKAMLEAYAKTFMQAKQQLVEEAKQLEKKTLSGLFRNWYNTSWFGHHGDYSLYLFSSKNKFRQRCTWLCGKKWFDFIILAFIGLNCLTLALERPDIEPGSIERVILNISNYVFTVIFTIEMAVKIVAKGCILGPTTYFRDGWCQLDGTLVIINLVSIFFELFLDGAPKIFGVMRVLRLLRALRPLRVINRAPGVKLVVQTLISSLAPIGNIVLICCTFFIIFGILGVQLFKGTMWYCRSSIGHDMSHIKTKNDCDIEPNAQWDNQRYNFDNLGQALMALFVVASKDGWVAIMYQGIDAVGVDKQPITNYNEWRIVYFISFLLLVGFFVLNMFVGVVVENFHKCKEALEKEMLEKEAKKKLEKRLKKQMSRAQLLEKKARELPYWYHYGPNRMYLHTIIMSKYFDLAIAAVIGVNVLTMAMEFYAMPKELEYALDVFNFFFTAVFTLEAIMKVVVMGLRPYFSDRWNQLDVGIVFLSIAGIIMEKMHTGLIPINPTIIRVMRVLRIARVLKLLKMAKGIRSLLDTVAQALPQVGNLGLLFFLLFFIFAALGVELFGRIECSVEHPCDGLGEHAHFKDFGMAFLTLFRIATGDNWNGIMKDALREDCDSKDHCQRNCCVSPIIAPIYFVIFVLMAQFVLVNVVVAVLMKHLEESNKKMADTGSEAGATTPGGTDTEGNYRTDDTEEAGGREDEVSVFEDREKIVETIENTRKTDKDNAEIKEQNRSNAQTNDLYKFQRHALLRHTVEAPKGTVPPRLPPPSVRVKLSLPELSHTTSQNERNLIDFGSSTPAHIKDVTNEDQRLLPKRVFSASARERPRPGDYFSRQNEMKSAFKAGSDQKTATFLQAETEPLKRRNDSSKLNGQKVSRADLINTTIDDFAME
uniref:Ion transport domain-containing protein n=1 Tax=Romanomermis culicivorax TaxID=13658 RepID=A0A915K0X9_ROMCU